MTLLSMGASHSHAFRVKFQALDLQGCNLEALLRWTVCQEPGTNGHKEVEPEPTVADDSLTDPLTILSVSTVSPPTHTHQEKAHPPSLAPEAQHCAGITDKASLTWAIAVSSQGTSFRVFQTLLSFSKTLHLPRRSEKQLSELRVFP